MAATPSSPMPSLPSSKPPRVSSSISTSLKSNSFNYSHFLTLLQTYKTLLHVKSIHAQILKNGLEYNVNLSTLLYNHYTSQNAVKTGRNLLSCVQKSDVLSWNLVIKACSRSGQFGQCLELFVQMQRAGFGPDEFTYPCVLNACAGPSFLPAGQNVHARIIKSGLECNVYVSSALINMYATCGRVDYAKKVFDEMDEKDLVCWNSIITGLLKDEKFMDALNAYAEMRDLDVGPNRTTLSCAISACGRVKDLELGQQIHGQVVKLGDEMVENVSVNTSLVFMYAKCEDMNSSRQVFESMPERNVVSWNAVISGYVQNKEMKEAWHLFKKMQLEDVEVGEITLTSMILACQSLLEVRTIHAYLVKTGLIVEEIIGAALIEMYGNCGSLNDARSVFDETPRTEMGAWNSMLLGYVRNGQPREALNLFLLLEVTGLRPDVITLVGVLSACTNLGSIQQGRYVHDYIISKGIEVNLVLGTALINMYARCGSVEMAREIFEGMIAKDLVTWGAMIAGHGVNGQAKEAADLFSRMVKEGFQPDNVTFTSVLSACSHTGLLKEGWDFFNQMTNIYGLTPKSEQYACMVDLLGRAGQLDEAIEFIKAMPIEPDVSVWGALLGACRIYNNMELGAYAAEKLFELDPKDPGYYVLLSNLYAFSGKRDDAKRVRELMKTRGLRKPPGCSWVDLGGTIHEFYVGDESHPQFSKIYKKLSELEERMKELGYVADTNLVLHDVEEEVKKEFLSRHSERLAIAFGLINTNPGDPIRVTKNLRVCPDCHDATKLISKIVRRRIVVRDAHRFHHFDNGVCSCGDYW
ncbi:pentatricopeptide repeat-containing protein At3g12770-like [Aristolochia californica]|uniref:pentatricopeptide repeat-containing protein At3g12770-like n=1 Tax=Aristolochia californica TaxID=171875 RepID=UPI0035D76B78